MEYLTHREVETLLTAFMEKVGWIGLRNGRYKSSYLKPDKVFIKQGNQQQIRLVNGKFIIEGKDPTTLVMEVKPEGVEKSEIAKGIGQCACYLVHNNTKPYLVIPERYLSILQNVFKQLPWLGIITYTKEHMEIAQRSNRDNDSISGV